MLSTQHLPLTVLGEELITNQRFLSTILKGAKMCALLYVELDVLLAVFVDVVVDAVVEEDHDVEEDVAEDEAWKAAIY